MSPPVVVGYLATVSTLLFDEAVFSRNAGYYERCSPVPKKKVSTRIVQLNLCMHIRN